MLSDKQIQDAVFAVLRKWKDDRAWDRYTRESGPYDVSSLRPEVLEIIRAVLAVADGAQSSPDDPPMGDTVDRSPIGLFIGAPVHRLTLLLRELAARFPEAEKPFSSEAPEPRYLAAIDALLAAAAPMGDTIGGERQKCESFDACEHGSPLYCMKHGCRTAALNSSPEGMGDKGGLE